MNGFVEPVQSHESEPRAADPAVLSSFRLASLTSSTVGAARCQTSGNCSPNGEITAADAQSLSGPEELRGLLAFRAFLKANCEKACRREGVFTELDALIQAAGISAGRRGDHKAIQFAHKPGRKKGQNCRGKGGELIAEINAANVLRYACFCSRCRYKCLIRWTTPRQPARMAGVQRHHHVWAGNRLPLPPAQGP